MEVRCDEEDELWSLQDLGVRKLFECKKEKGFLNFIFVCAKCNLAKFFRAKYWV